MNAEAGSLNMNLYFNNSLENSVSSSGASSVSLKMPSELYMEYMQKDSIDLILNFKSSSSQSPLKCRMAVSDFMAPSY